jgi:hypothetical protein
MGHQSGKEHNISRVLVHIERVNLPLADFVVNDGYYYPRLPFCVIDTVFSLNARYRSVENVIDRYWAQTGKTKFRRDPHQLPATKEQESISAFIDRLRAVGCDERGRRDETLSAFFGNRARTSPRLSAMRKAGAVLKFAEVLHANKIEYLQDLGVAFDSGRLANLEAAVKTVPGQMSSDIGWRYFLMLTGNDDEVKPDRIIRRFLSSALGCEVTADDAAALVIVAAQRLQSKYPHMTPRLLDHKIWRYESKWQGD